MDSTIRAGWIRPFSFSDEQRGRLSKVLRRFAQERINSYLDAAQSAVTLFLHEMDVTGTVPPERPAVSLELLGRIARHARELESALKDLDLTGSEMALAFALSRLGRGHETVEYMLNDLPLLYICAEGADQFIGEPKRGRPDDEIEKRLIVKMARLYHECFDKKPTYSRGTIFSRLVSEVLNIAQPGNPHTAKDNSKIIESALRAAGTIS